MVELQIDRFNKKQILSFSTLTFKTFSRTVKIPIISSFEAHIAKYVTLQQVLVHFLSIKRQNLLVHLMKTIAIRHQIQTELFCS